LAHLLGAFIEDQAGLRSRPAGKAMHPQQTKNC
jgi:hypothetical protein